MKLKEVQCHPLTTHVSSIHCSSWSEDNRLAILTRNGILVVGFQRLFPMVILLSLFLCFSPAGANDITDVVFGKYAPGIPAAFGDFNSDEKTDLFTIKTDDKGSSVEILLGFESEPLFRPDPNLVCTFTQHEITSVVPGDFDGDVMMDVLVTAKKKGDSNKDFTTYVFVHKGSIKSLNCADENKAYITMKGQPLAVDYNKDMIIDLFGVDEHGKRLFWVFPKNLTNPSDIKTYPLVEGSDSNHSTDQFRSPHSNAFVDLSGDYDADLYITYPKHIEYWNRKVGKSFEEFGFIKNVTTDLKLPDGKLLDGNYIGQTTFLDFQSTGELFQLIPSCTKSNAVCKNSDIYVLETNENSVSSLNPLLIKFYDKSNRKWNFAHDENKDFLNAVTLRAGDFNMDGYPDLLATLSPENDTSIKQTFLLENVQLSTNNDRFKRSFEVQWDALSSVNKNTILGIFYDFFQDGILDVIFVRQDLKVTAFRNSLDYDANFLKAIVVSGIDQNFVASQTSPIGKKHPTFGTNLYGPTISYQTTTPEGQPQKACSAQMPQSAHFSLILPYTIFGLGRSPNFIDSLTVYIFGNKKSWPQLIPNSQVIVVPHPIDNPGYWKAQLFVTPSKIILQSAFALLGTCLLISAIIAILYWKERKEDKREKLQQAQRFHFDAM